MSSSWCGVLLTKCTATPGSHATEPILASSIHPRVFGLASLLVASIADPTVHCSVGLLFVGLRTGINCDMVTVWKAVSRGCSYLYRTICTFIWDYSSPGTYIPLAEAAGSKWELEGCWFAPLTIDRRTRAVFRHRNLLGASKQSGRDTPFP